MYTVKNVAERLRVSQGTVYAAIADGRLRSYRLGRGRGAIRILEEGVRKFLEQAAVEPPPPAIKPQSGFRHLKLR
jgi:excisionase family DNA binding protein